MYIIKTILVIAIWLSVKTVMAQEPCNFIIEGYVIDEHDNQPLTNANIIVAETGYGCVSDAKGYYRIEGICEGINTLICSHVGCESITVVLNVKENVTFDFLLEHHAHLLEAISITARKINTRASASMNLINRQEIERNVLSDFSEFLSTVPGVKTLRSGSNISKPILHGMSGNRIKLIYNEISIEDQQWGAEHAPSVLLSNSEEIQVIKGAGTVKYGSDAIAGAIVASPLPIPKGEKFSTKIYTLAETVNALASLGFNMKSSFKKNESMGWNLGGDFASNGDTHTPRYFQNNTGARRYNYHFSWGQRKSNLNYRLDYQHLYRETGILKFAHIGNVSDFVRAIESDTPIIQYPYQYRIDAPRQQVHHHIVSGTFNYILKNDINLKATAAYQSNHRREYDIRRGGRSALPSLQMHLQTNLIDLEMVDFKKDKFKTNAGIQFQQQYNYNNPRTLVKPLIPDFRTYQTGLFVVEEILMDKVNFELGVRYDYMKQNILFYERVGGKDTTYSDNNSYHNFSYNAGVYWKLREHFYIKFNTGTAFRNPHVSELYSDGLHHGAAIYEKGNADLGTEKSLNNSLELAVEYPKVRFKINTYHHHFFNYIFKSLEGVIPTIRGTFPIFGYRESKATIMGSDVDLEIFPHKYVSLQHSADYVLGWIGKSKNNLPEIPPASLSHSIAFRYPIEGKKIKEFHTSLKVETFFKVQNTLNIVRADSLISLSNDEIQQLINQSGFLDFTAPPPTYTLLNWESGFKLDTKSGRMEFLAGIKNLTNKTYRNYLNRFRYFTDDAGINFYIKTVFHIFNH